MTLLATQALRVGYRDHRVAGPIDLDLRAGEVVCLIGPNGVGKSTLFRTLLGLIPAPGGRVLIDSRDQTTMTRAEIATQVALVPQAYTNAFAFTVLDLVMMGRTVHLPLFGQPGGADRDIAVAALDAMNIADLADRDLNRISGGQRQLALIARAIAQQSRIVLMDEPTASLDLGNRIRVLDRIGALAGSGVAVLVSTHEPDQAFEIADRVAVIAPGGVFEIGTPDEILTEQRLSALYDARLSIERTTSGRSVVLSRKPAQSDARASD